MKQITLLLAGLTLLLSACSTEQDPMANQPENVKNGQPPGIEKPTDTIDPKHIVFESEDFYTLKEGEKQTITINVRYLKDAPEYEVALKNQADFENIKVTSVKGNHTTKGIKPAQISITWTPKVDGSDYMKKTQWDLVLIIPSAGVSTTRAIPVFVERKLEVPSIVRDERMPTEMREGETAMGVVYVMDATAENTPGNRPVLSLESETTGVPQLTPFISIGQPRSMGNNLWAFDVRFDLRNEVTATLYETNLKFVAKNRFGKVSTEKMYNIKVKTNLTRPETSWTNKEVVTFKVGQTNIYNFWILDPKFEGELKMEVLEDVTKWPGKATLVCPYVTSPVNGSTNSQMFCTLTWEIPAGATDKSKNLKLSIKNNSKITGDVLSVTESFDRMIMITP